MALPANKTLEELRTALRARLGFGSQGSSSGAAAALLDDILREAQEALYWEYDFPVIHVARDATVGVGQTLVDYPNDIEPLKITSVQILVNTIWLPLDEGIDFRDDSYVTVRTYPQKFDRRAQIELWPENDSVRTLRVEGAKRLDAFTQNSHRTTLDSDLVQVAALAMAKEHYRQPDADIYRASLNRKLARIKSSTHGLRRYIPGVMRSGYPFAVRPLIV